MKKIATLVSGIILEIIVLWGSNSIIHWGLDRINWHSVFVWLFFFGGFVSAYWLILWSKLVNRFLQKRVTSSSTTSSVEEKTPAAPAPQQEQAPVSEPAQESTPEPEVEEATPAAPSAPAPSPAPTPRMAPPTKITVQNNAVLTMNPTSAPAPNQTAPNAPAAAPAHNPSQKEQDIVQLSDIDPDLDMMAFKHVALEGKIIDLVYSSDDVAVLCKLFSDPHTWTVDTTQPIEECTWTDETGAEQHPCENLLSQVVALKKMEAEAQIIPTIVLMRGTIQNYQEVENYLLQNQITLVQYEVQPGSDGRTLHDLLREKFTLFPEDGEGEYDEGATDETEDTDSDEEDVDTDSDDTSLDEDYTENEENFEEEAPQDGSTQDDTQG